MDAIDLKAAQIAATQHGTFRSEQVPGLSNFHVRVRVRSGRWLRIAPSTFLIAGSPTTWEQQMWTTLHRSGAGAVVGLRSAARVHEIPNFDGDHLEAIGLGRDHLQGLGADRTGGAGQGDGGGHGGSGAVARVAERGLSR